jgi:sirohydrochlorin ferrochelatase
VEHDEGTVRPATGDPRVDEALGRLDELAGLPVTEHPAVFEHVHARLAEALGDLDQTGPGEPGVTDEAGAGLPDDRDEGFPASGVPGPGR